MTDVVSGVMVSVSCLAFPPVDLVVAVPDPRVDNEEEDFVLGERRDGGQVSS